MSPSKKPPRILNATMEARRPEGAGVQPDNRWNDLEEKIRLAEADYEDACRQTRTGEKRKKETKEEIEDLEEAKRDHLVCSALLKGVSRFDRLNPQKLIQLIAGFSIMTPEQLGWDTSMKIYRFHSDEDPAHADVKPSYEVATQFQDQLQVNQSRYEIHWVIDVEEAGNTEQYVTVSTVSAIRSAEICSRATIVFEVIKFKERRDPKRTYALKRYWRPIHADDAELHPTEGAIYKQFDDRLAINGDEVRPKRPKHALASHDIMVNGIPDDTLESIRRGLTSERHKKAIAPLDPLILETDPDAENRLDKEPTARLQTAPREPVNRCHTQILMPMGIVIKLFSSLYELICCLIDCIAGHQEAHDVFFTLHRDVSSGNLLIFHSLDGDGTTFGRLIDYDHAKQARSAKLVRDPKEPLSDDQLATMRSIFQVLFPLQQLEVNKDVLNEACTWLQNPLTAANYILAVVAQYFPDIAPKSIVDITKLAWKIPDPHRKWPDWQARRARSTVERTGTLPYMSAEVIQGDYIVPKGNVEMPSFAHEAIHDLESFLWVLVRICLTRQGPGINAYRDELIEESPKYAPDIAATVQKYFQTEDSSALSHAKASVMKRPMEFENIINHFHPYFNPLKDLVLSRLYSEFFDIHECILGLLKNIRPSLKDLTENDAAREIDRRKKLEQKRLATFSPKRAETPSSSSAGPGLD
ncbi:hypothetical protein H0H93_000496 [Arthromyces matolae]|nr:hypothetical protein H0H93_000496 [Arthromyces matolae]